MMQELARFATELYWNSRRSHSGGNDGECDPPLTVEEKKDKLLRLKDLHALDDGAAAPREPAKRQMLRSG